MRAVPTGPPVVSVLLISASALALEVLLMRLFAIVQWHHFAYMIISLALLGYGVSGTFVTLCRSWLLRRFGISYLLNSTGFAVSTLGGFLCVQRLPFNPLEILWDPGQWLYLLAAYLVLLLPFFFAANCIVLAFAAFDRHIPRIYGFDLVGAGLGSLGILALLFLLAPERALQALGMVAVVATGVAALELRLRYRWPLLASSLMLAALGPLLPPEWVALEISPYNPLSQALQVAGTKVTETRSGPHGQLTVLENPRIPFRLAEGLSLNNRVEPPAQYAVFVDGGDPSPITRYDGDDRRIAYLDYQTSALPFHLATPGPVLIIGLGGGSGLLQARYHGAAPTVVVELNPQIAALLQGRHAEFAGWPLLSPHTEVRIAEARGFLARDDRRYRIIQMSLLDAAGASSAGLYALNENYLYTREGLALFYRHLEPGGLLAITRWVKLPPRDGLKLVATAAEMLRSEGLEEPGRRLAMIRGWQTSTLLIRKGYFDPAEIAGVRRFCEERSFDVVWYPGITAPETNRFNVLASPYFYEGAKALLGPTRDAFIDDYKFAIAPATDDRPYFFNFFKWRSLGEILSLRRQGGFSLVELGYLVLVLTLLQALVVSFMLVLVPLLFRSRDREMPPPLYTGGILFYFTAIGLAFLFIEIAFIQRFILFLAEPVYTVAVMLFGFLLFSGLGSFASRRLAERYPGNDVAIAVAGIVVFTLVSIGLHPPIFSALSHQPAAVKFLVSMGLIAPLAFFMGMPFPLALSRIAQRTAWLLPWAWGVNGFASLMSAIIATLLALHFGFSAVLIAAIALYTGAALVHRAALAADGAGAH